MPPTVLTREICRNYIEAHLLDPAISNDGKANDGVGYIGLELESFPYIIDPQKGVQPAQLYGSKESLVNALIHVSEQHGGLVQYLDQTGMDERHEPLVGAIHFPDGSTFQFEPGGQIEIATAPCNCIEQLNDQLTGMQQILGRVTQNNQFQFAQYGTNPWFTADKIGLQMNKTRYRAMARYFDEIGAFGRMMMVQTSSLHVNVDSGSDWSTRSKRYVAANLLAPFATALFSNSPITAGKVTGHKSYRSFIWQQLDTTRTGVFPIEKRSSTFDKEAIIDAYLDFALKAPVIFIEDFGDEPFPLHVTMEYWINHSIKGLSPVLAHFMNHLTLLFPEVRLKGYLELRSVDAPPPEWQMTPALFYGGLLYSDQYLDKVLDLLLPFASQIPLFMKKATYGLESDDLFHISKKLVQLAIDGFSTLPESFKRVNDLQQLIAFSQRFPLRRQTFADELLRKLNKISFS
ncbi:glutamate-cysteine ligase family protein [Spirosoma sp.]|uniref:glutamate-cysteine ligase family protein n=1 Tax=Spirosoma sp. TaxID=1899569 RepID=UPI00260849BC|nr:glutamate-cysteine ligase family protein [Spirosoma sp.]MCX6214758.1 glutamate-cysteine ligase family protein [Spirosoma sp.]